MFEAELEAINRLRTSEGLEPRKSRIHAGRQQRQLPDAQRDPLCAEIRSKAAHKPQELSRFLASLDLTLDRHADIAAILYEALSVDAKRWESLFVRELERCLAACESHATNPAPYWVLGAFACLAPHATPPLRQAVKQQFLKALSSPVAPLRQAAINLALGCDPVVDHQVLEAVEGLLDDPDWRVRSCAESELRVEGSLPRGYRPRVSDRVRQRLFSWREWRRPSEAKGPLRDRMRLRGTGAITRVKPLAATWKRTPAKPGVKTVGVIGGIGPESTIEYYRFLIAEYRSRARDGGYPPVLINSIDMTKMLALIEASELGAVTDYLTGEVLKLAKAGADFAVLASNTPHIVFDQLRRRAPVPMISIVEATCDVALAMKLKRVGLFGTRVTMQGHFYSRVLSEHGIAVVVPEPEDQTYIHEKYLVELVRGLIFPETRERLLAIAGRLRERQQVEGIILGGTELPLILRDAPSPGVPFLDTTTIHVKRIVAEMLSGAT